MADDFDTRQPFEGNRTVGVIRVVMREDQIPDRQFADLAYRCDQPPAQPGRTQAVDDYHAFGRDDKSGITVKAAIFYIDFGDIAVEKIGVCRNFVKWQRF